uniref:Metallopeptidase family M24 n=1 Tax=Mimivirus LCMiAC02 TaxID=2506609 RepID=A0A4D5XEU2_9VIRU|nr:MAG: metallopeptidase family M24 [Mimivirus LCMiAC02]
MISDPMEQLDFPNRKSKIRKYKEAGRIAGKALNKLIDMIKPGVKIYDLCIYGDNYILEEVSKIYPNLNKKKNRRGKLKKNEKGIAFPTCISINNIAGHFSPHSNDLTTIATGDLVKIELGVHIDSFPAMIAYTVVVTDGEMVDKVTESSDKEKEKVVRAVYEAGRRIIKIMKPGIWNTDIVKILCDCAKQYNCSLPSIKTNIYTPGTFSYQMSRFVIDSYGDDDETPHHYIFAKDLPFLDYSLCKLKLEKNEVYAIDIVMASKKGKMYTSNELTTVYRLVPETKAHLTKSGNIVRESFRNYRFPLKYTNKNRYGLKECINKKVIEPYHIIKGSNNEYIARLKFTVIVDNEPILITGKSLNEQLAKFNNN